MVHKCLQSLRIVYEIALQMCLEEITVRLNSLKMATVDAETRRSGKQCVIWHAQCSAQKLVNKPLLQNMTRGTIDMKTNDIN